MTTTVTQHAAISPELRRDLLHVCLLSACRDTLSGRITGTLDGLSRIVGMRVVIASFSGTEHDAEGSAQDMTASGQNREARR